MGGIDLNKPRIRAALTAVLALAAAPAGFTVADLATRVHAITGNADYTVRHAANDLRKLRGKELIIKPGCSRRYHVLPPVARTIAARLVLRDHVIASILAGVQTPRMGRKPTHWTRTDRDYETLRINMQTLFHDLGHHQHRRGIDNFLSIEVPQAPSALIVDLRGLVTSQGGFWTGRQQCLRTG